jgi:NAD(P)-dependent dehydrogenase (short-subunit alcohol dehydrogenase family)
LEKKKILERLLFPSVKVKQQDLNKAIKGKIVLITGASYGIGECVANGLAREGVTLILVARTAEKLQSLKKDLEQTGAIVHTFSADLRNEEALNALFVYMRQYSLEKVDILISNAESRFIGLFTIRWIVFTILKGPWRSIMRLRCK